MAITDPEEIKNIIRGNFDRSVDLYEDFEGKYGLFKDLTLMLADRCGVKKGMTVCDIGCGTGSHSLELAKTAAMVLGVDIDPLMIQKAQQRAVKVDSKAKFECTSVHQVLEKDFDLVTALFYVVNYIQTLPELIAFAEAICRRLKYRGVFIFDAWNGTAALNSPALEERRTVKAHRGEDAEPVSKEDVVDIVVSIVPTTHYECTTLNYQFQITESSAAGRGVNRCSFGYQIKKRLWTLRILEEVMEMVGFSSVKFFQEGSPKTPAADDTWKIMGVCLK